MQAILFIGIQATGKTTFYLNNFLRTHIHISLDQLNTRNKEAQFIDTCLSTQQAFVVDNTNPTRAERTKNSMPSGSKTKSVMMDTARATLELLGTMANACTMVLTWWLLRAKVF